MLILIIENRGGSSVKCPKCNLKISKSAKKCPFCETKIANLKERIDELPKIITNPRKVTKEEALEKTKKIKIKPIPLEVKKIKKVKEKDEYSPTIEIPKLKIVAEAEKKQEKKFVFFSNIKVIAVIVILILNLAFITKAVLDSEKNNPNKQELNVPNLTISPSNEIGIYRSSTNGLFIFQDNKTFYWFDSYLNQKDNYYAGTYNYKKGKDALAEMGYSEEEFYLVFGSNTKIDNLYSMNLIPSFVQKAGENVTSRELKENESWWYILVIKEDGNAIAYNKTLDLRYNLAKN